MFTKALESVGRMLGLGHTTDEERRVWGRIRCDLETTCRLAADSSGPATTIRVYNISAGGVGMTTSRNFTPGTLLSMTLPGESEASTQVLACVVRCDSLDDMRWDLGCTFAGVLDDNDLARFGARRETTGPRDKRHWVRFGCHAQTTYQIVRAPAPTDPVDARVRDISAGGISLVVNETVRVGDLLSLDLSRDGEYLLTTLASVVRTEVGPDGESILGCNFIRELPEDLLARMA